MRVRDQKENKNEKISLKDVSKEASIIDGYYLNPNDQYVINLNEEIAFQASIVTSFQIMGPPPAIKNYHAWLFENGFNVDMPNPSNEFVSNYYGVKPLWKTDYSLGIVVKNENDSDYYIVMECSSKNRGYKHTNIILTLGGCI